MKALLRVLYFSSLALLGSKDAALPFDIPHEHGDKSGGNKIELTHVYRAISSSECSTSYHIEHI